MNDSFTWPVGRAAQRRSVARRAPLGPVLAYVLASTLGGIATAMLLAVGGRVSDLDAVAPVVKVAVLVVVASGTAVLELADRISPLPERRRQVPRRWLAWRRQWVAAAAFGAVIGAGVLTHLRHAAAYFVGALVLLAPSIGAGVALGLVYGLARGGVLLITYLVDISLGVRLPWQRLAAARRTPAGALILAMAVVTAVLATAVPS